MRLLDDRPGSAPHIPHLFEQDKVCRGLKRQIKTALREIAHAEGGFRGRIFALIGRHGQGKSSVVAEIMRAFPAAKRFDVSEEAGKDLEENFDFFFVKSYWSVIAFFIIVASIFYMLLYIMMKEGVFRELRFFPSILIAGALASLAHYRVFVRKQLRYLRLKGWQWFSEMFGRLRKWLFDPPDCDPLNGGDLVIIDDLDRATPQQQGALLLALRRYRDHLNKVILVSFDDEPLLTWQRERPDPEELLTRTFDATFRLAPMNLRDAVDMACHFLGELRKKNDDDPLARQMCDPQIVADVARTFYLHGTASARFARRFVNNLYVDASRLRPRDINDISALVRLHGLFRYVPVLESDMDLVVRRFLHHDEFRLIDDLEERFGEKMRPDRRRALHHFLENTRHMQPFLADWGFPLRIWNRHFHGAAEDRVGRDCDKDYPEAVVHHWALWDVHLAAIDDPEERLRQYRLAVASPVPPEGNRELPGEGEEESPCDGMNTRWPEKDMGVRRALVYRLMAQDRAVIQRLTAGELQKFIESYQEVAQQAREPRLPPAFMLVNE